MNKTLKKILIIAAIIAAGLMIAFKILQYNTKKASPEATASYSNGTNISVKYCKPSKKGREIFGKLVPFGEVWRTGANEATTFTTDKDLTIGGKTLAAGTYTLWTVPGQATWKVIFNNKQYGWGVNLDTKASREADGDVLEVEVPVSNTDNVVEQFNISFTDTPTAMVLEWDNTKVSVPIMK